MSTARLSPARKAALTVGTISVATALLVSGCGTSSQSSAGQPAAQSSPSNNNDYVQVCEDTDTQQRVEDDRCDGNLSNTHYRPSYYNYGSLIPAVGAGMLAGYLLSAPARSNVYRGAAPRTGGYAPTTRPNSGFLKVPDDFVSGTPVVPPAPTAAPSAAPRTQATSPAQPSNPQSGTKATTSPQKKSTDDTSTKKNTDSTTKKGTTLKAPSTRRR